MDDAIRALARDAGLAVDWIDATDKPQTVSVDSLRRILEALGLPCASSEQLDESRQQIAAWQRDRSLVTATVGRSFEIDGAIEMGAEGAQPRRAHDGWPESEMVRCRNSRAFSHCR